MSTPKHFPYKVGFIGLGHMAQALIAGFLEKSILTPHQIYGFNRSPGKIQKVVDHYAINATKSSEEVVEKSDIVVLAMKPQDLGPALDPLLSIFSPNQIVITLAAGITLHSLSKKLPNCRLARVMPNTATSISRGVIGYSLMKPDPGLTVIIEDLFSGIAYTVHADDEDRFEAILVASASGTGFIFELMSYWQDWIEEHGFESAVARQLTIETFLGASMLAKQSKDSSFEELTNKVASKKGTTAAGLESMRELEIERAIRYSFEKAALKNQELAKGL